MMTIRMPLKGQAERTLPPDAGLSPTFFSRLMAMISWPYRYYESRSVYAQIARLSDVELRDIGLTRQDVRDASGLGLGEDPTLLLSERAFQTRLTAHGRAR